MSQQQSLCEPLRPSQPPPRPQQRDSDIIQDGIKLALPAFRQYLGEEFREQDITEDLTKLLDDSFDWDGYTLARRLENKFHWGEDRELVDLCDELAAKVVQVERDVIEQWIKAFHIEPQLSRNQSVRVTVRNRITHDGIILDIDRKQGKYVVMVPALGHVASGIGTHGVLLNWEDVERDGS